MHNFARASSRDDIVHGAQRPGYGGGVPVPQREIADWIAHMRGNGIDRVVCLLDDSQLDRYYPDGQLFRAYDAAFPIATVNVQFVDYQVPSEANLLAVLKELADAFDNKQRIVVHCSAGMGRTGIVLSAWLRYQHGLKAARAIRMVEEYAYEHGATRYPREAGEGVDSLLDGIVPRTR